MLHRFEQVRIKQLLLMKLFKKIMIHIKLSAPFLLFAFCISCKAQNKKTVLPKQNTPSETMVTSPGPNEKYHTKYEYTDSAGKRLIIENSYPRGGIAINGNRGYTDPAGTIYGFGIFWTRVINEAAAPLELTINFPADSFAVSSAPSYYKLLLPPGTMTLDKQSLFNYGYEISDINSFLNTSFNKPTMLRRTIKPKEECLFYVMMLNHVYDQNGPIRAGFFSKGKDLFYRIKIDPFDSQIIPCGEIAFNKYSN
jgi:hypothetical protein